MASNGFDFSGLATKYNTKCADGRTIIHGAFDEMDGKRVPLLYNHDHKNPKNVLGYAILHSVDEGLRADAFLDESSEAAQDIKHRMLMGTPFTYSIHATDLRQRASDVLHGIIREVSVVLAGANPGAVIDHLSLSHEYGMYSEEEAYICFENELSHSFDADEESEEEDSVEETAEAEEENVEESTEEESSEEEISHSTDKSEEPSDEKKDEDSKETVQDVLDSMTDKQRKVTFALVGMAAEDKEKKDEKNPEGGTEMAHTNIFESDSKAAERHELTHAQQGEILAMARDNNLKFSQAMEAWAEENLSEDELSHGLNAAAKTYFLPEFQKVTGGKEPELWTDDMAWVAPVINGAHKTPFSRIKTELVDARGLRAKGYVKGSEKTEIDEMPELHRTTDPQTIYVKDSIDRDDMLDITDFDVVAYQEKVMAMYLKLEIARAILIGDGRAVNHADKIKEDKVRPIWTDDELYTIHKELDVASYRTTLQGTGTGTSFGDEFVYSEAMVAIILDALIDYRGSGNLTMFCTQRTLNKMLLARDMNGRRIYNTKAELATALNVKDIIPVAQFEGLTRTVTVEVEGANVQQEKKLLAILVNMTDYNIGSVKGGEVTHFEDFDIDFNKEKFLDETRISGALHRIKSAIVIEEPVVQAQG